MNDDRIAGLDTLITPAPSDDFWTGLHDALVAAATEEASTDSPDHDLVDVADGPGIRTHRPAWRLLAAVAAIVAIVGGLTAYALGRPDTSAPADRVNGVITDPTTIDLDPWRPAGYMQKIDVGGPYEVFDLTRLPAGWIIDPGFGPAGGTDFVGPGNPADWSWIAPIVDPDGASWVLFVSSPRDGTEPTLDDSGDPVDVRRTHGVVIDDGSLHWVERGVAVELRWPDTATSQAAVTLADTLAPTSVDALTERPSSGEPMSRPDQFLLAGTLDGAEWWLDTRPSATEPSPSTLSLVLNGVVEGSSSGPIDMTGFGDVGVPGHGRISFGLTDADLGSIRVVLSDQTSVVLPVRHQDDGTTLFAIPLPIGLDAVSIDYIATDGHILRTRRTPPLTDASGMLWSQDTL